MPSGVNQDGMFVGSSGSVDASGVGACSPTSPPSQSPSSLSSSIILYVGAVTTKGALN